VLVEVVTEEMVVMTVVNDVVGFCAEVGGVEKLVIAKMLTTRASRLTVFLWFKSYRRHDDSLGG